MREDGLQAHNSSKKGKKKSAVTKGVAQARLEGALHCLQVPFTKTSISCD